jgi:hypothetical protein
MQLDLDMWLSEMEAAHPDPYTRIDREAFHARVRTLLEADVSTARFVRADGDVTNKEPVMPDIVVHQSIEEWLRHEDPILRRALTWIATGR